MATELAPSWPLRRARALSSKSSRQQSRNGVKWKRDVTAAARGPSEAGHSVKREPMTNHKPHHLDIVGDFYVEEDCCLRCDLPQSIAPELFASFDELELCFVKKQPRTTEELDRMIEVMTAQTAGCVRYRGRDEVTIQRILKVADAELIDR